MVNIFKWEDSLTTGFDEVDLQHKKLLLIIDDVNKSMEAIDRREADASVRLSKDLKRLTDYTVYHFTDEEVLMKRYDYPGLETHHEEHQGFVAKVISEIQNLGDPSTDTAFKLYRFLGSWVITHIKGSDQEWATYIAEKTSTKPV